jgi:hypothetical protein
MPYSTLHRWMHCISAYTYGFTCEEGERFLKKVFVGNARLHGGKDQVQHTAHASLGQAYGALAHWNLRQKFPTMNRLSNEGMELRVDFRLKRVMSGL